MMKEESLPDGLSFPSFSSLELSRLITTVFFSKDTYLVYVLQIPLLQSTVYQLYKMQPFPTKQQDNVFVYIETRTDFIFVGVMRHKYGKTSYQDLQACLTPSEFNYVCQETLPILTYVIHTQRRLKQPSFIPYKLSP